MSAYKKSTNSHRHTHTKKKPPKQCWAENKEFVFTVGSGDNTWQTEIDWVLVCAVCACVCVLLFHIFGLQYVCVPLCVVTPWAARPADEISSWTGSGLLPLPVQNIQDMNTVSHTDTKTHLRTANASRGHSYRDDWSHLMLLCLCMCKCDMTFPEF